MQSSIRNIVPKYEVKVRRKAERFIDGIPEKGRKEEAIRLVNDLPDYPSVLGRWDIQKIEGRENSYRVRIGRYRIGFVVDKHARTIEVTDATIK